MFTNIFGAFTFFFGMMGVSRGLKPWYNLSNSTSFGSKLIVLGTFVTLLKPFLSFKVPLVAVDVPHFCNSSRCCCCCNLACIACFLARNSCSCCACAFAVFESTAFAAGRLDWHRIAVVDFVAVRWMRWRWRVLANIVVVVYYRVLYCARCCTLLLCQTNNLAAADDPSGFWFLAPVN